MTSHPHTASPLEAEGHVERLHRVFATGDRALVEQAWSVLAWTDPSPADAVDCKEESRTLWRLDAYAPNSAAAAACIELLQDAVPALRARAEPVENRDWVALSLEGLPAVEAGRFVVAGGHSLPGARAGRLAIHIEAGPAFGTGHHGTTLGCLLAHQKIRQHHRPKRLLDVGTGTGVLAIAAVKDGARLAIATDIDADSVITTRENGAANQIGRKLKVRLARGINHPLVRESAPYDLVFANILARPLVRLAEDLASVTATGGHVILSGLLTHQAPLVRRAYLGHGLQATAHIRIDGWSTLVFRRPHPFPGGPFPQGPFPPGRQKIDRAS